MEPWIRELERNHYPILLAFSSVFVVVAIVTSCCYALIATTTKTNENSAHYLDNYFFPAP